MSFARSPLAPALLVPFLALPGIAAADLTAAGLWQEWQTAAEARGMSIMAAEVSPTEDGLRLDDVTARLPQDDGTTITAEIPLITLSELEDERVALALPDNKRITVTDPEDEAARTVLEVDTGALTVTASGAPGATDYSWGAPTLSVTLLEYAAGATSVEAAFLVTAVDLSGRLTGYDAAAESPVTAVFEAAETAWELALRDPRSGAEASAEAAQEQVVIQAESIGAAPLEEGQLEDASDGDGLEIDAPEEDVRFRFAFDSANGTSRSSQTENGETLVSETSHESASLRMDVTPLTAFMTGAGAGITLSIDDPAFPVRPLTLTLDELDMAFLRPLAHADDPQPFDMTLELIGVTATETLWAQLDPAAALPRDPMTLTADLEGLALVGPAARLPGLPAGVAEDFAPTEVTVNRIDLTYGEARAEVTGEVRFPTPTGDAVLLSRPQPVGTLDVTLTGVRDLLAQLSQSGLLPQPQLLMAHMAIGMFTIPGAGDSMTSRIEARDGGSIYVNGNRVR